MKTTVSVVIAFKGQENLNLLQNCVRSLLNQTQEILEIIIVGTKNDLQNISFSQLKKSNTSINKIYADVDKNEAKNIGIKQAKGKYVLYLDHDMVADRNLIRSCLSFSNRYQAIIIPEIGMGGSFWLNCKKLEKEFMNYDPVSATPRFYLRSMFKDCEHPFDTNFGLLDEWGFKYKMQQQNNIKVGYCDSFVNLKENKFSLLKQMKYRFLMGMSMKYFYSIDKKQAWQRMNPIKRGILFYGSRVNYLFKEPLYFLGLLFLKSIELVAFMSGFFLKGNYGRHR